VARALGASPGKVKVLGLRAGSVIASVALCEGVLADGGSPMAAVAELQRQAMDPTSALMAGHVTNRCVGVHVRSDGRPRAGRPSRSSAAGGGWAGEDDAAARGIAAAGATGLWSEVAAPLVPDRSARAPDFLDEDAVARVQAGRRREEVEMGRRREEEEMISIEDGGIPATEKVEPTQLEAAGQSGWVAFGEGGNDGGGGCDASRDDIFEAGLGGERVNHELGGGVSQHLRGVPAARPPLEREGGAAEQTPAGDVSVPYGALDVSVTDLVAAMAQEEMLAELTNVEIDVHVRECVDAEMRAEGEAAAASRVRGMISFSWVVASAFDLVRLRRAPPAAHVSFCLAVSNLREGDLVAHDPSMLELVDPSNAFLPLTDDGTHTLLFKCRIHAPALSDRRPCIKYLLSDPSRAPCFPLQVQVHRELHDELRSDSVDGVSTDAAVESVTLGYSVAKGFR